MNESKPQVRIDGVSLKTAMQDWYDSNGRGGKAANVHVERCAERGLGLPCSTPKGGCKKLPFAEHLVPLKADDAVELPVHRPNLIYILLVRAPQPQLIVS